MARPSVNAGAAVQVRIARLKRQLRMGGRDMSDVLTTAAGNFQDVPSLRQSRPEHAQDNVAVARGGGSKAAVIMYHAPIVHFPPVSAKLGELVPASPETPGQDRTLVRYARRFGEIEQKRIA